MTGAYNTSFAHAVSRARSGIRPKAGVNVAVEGHPLAAILRSGQALDRHGLDLLALAVTGKLRSVKQPNDETMFAQAVRKASCAWRTGKNRSAATEGASLAKMLQAVQPPLGIGERALLADLLGPNETDAENDLHGRPWKGAGHPDAVAVLKILRKNLASGLVHKNAVSDTAKMFKISERTVEKYDAMAKKREAAGEAGPCRSG